MVDNDCKGCSEGWVSEGEGFGNGCSTGGRRPELRRENTCGSICCFPSSTICLDSDFNPDGWCKGGGSGAGTWDVTGGVGETGLGGEGDGTDLLSGV